MPRWPLKGPRPETSCREPLTAVSLVLCIFHSLKASLNFLFIGTRSPAWFLVASIASLKKPRGRSRAVGRRQHMRHQVSRKAEPASKLNIEKASCAAERESVVLGASK